MVGGVNRLDAQGRPYGVWEYYYTDGRVRWSVCYLRGALHGVWEYYELDGTLGRKGYFLTIK